MKKDKPSIPKGTRDFGPDKMLKRQFITDKIKTVFEKFGYQPMETPAMENLSVLTGKYGAEGDQFYCPTSEIKVLTSFSIDNPDDKPIDEFFIQIS